MRIRREVPQVIICGIAIVFSGCKSVPADAKLTASEKPASVSPSIAAEMPNLKIPPRPSDEMKGLTPLEEITKLFRATYATARSEVQHSQSIVILTRLSGATLFRNGKIIETVRVIPAEYHNLRYATHVPFMIFLKLQSHCDASLEPAMRADIEKYVTTIEQAGPSLVFTKLTEVQLDRQRRILHEATAFLKQVLHAGRVSTEGLRRYVRAASVDMEQNMREAGAAQVNGLHEQMLKWRSRMSDAEWRNIHFIVHGPQQPRGGSAMTLYFSTLLKDPGDGRGYLGESTRLVYREDTAVSPNNSPADPWEPDLELVAAIELDATASEALFSDPDRLAVDIVSDGARARIRELDFSKLQ
jgi:hypothetical protein